MKKVFLKSILSLLIPIWCTACSHTAPVTVETFDPSQYVSPGTTLEKATAEWMSGQFDNALATIQKTGSADPAMAGLLKAEILFEMADFPASAQLFYDVAHHYPDHPLCSWALIRLMTILVTSTYNVPFTELNQLDMLKYSDLDKYLLSYLTIATGIIDKRWQPDVIQPSGFIAPSDWAWAGPFSDSVWEDINQVLPPEKDAWLKDSYDKDGKQIKVIPIRDNLTMSAPNKESGVFYAETTLTLDQDAEFLMTSNSHKTPYKLWIDGQLVESFLPEQMATTGFRPRHITLAAGNHAIRLKLGILEESQSQGLSLIVLIPMNKQLKDISYKVDSDHRNGQVAGITLGEYIDVNGFLPNNPELVQNDPFYAWLYSLYEQVIGLPYKAIKALDKYKDADNVPIQIQLASVYQHNEIMDPSLRSDMASTLYQKVTENTPQAALATLQTVDTLRKLKMSKNALALLDANRDYLPDHADVDITKYLIYNDLNWDNEALMSLENAIRKLPANCSLMSKYLDEKSSNSVYLYPEDIEKFAGALNNNCHEVISYNVQYYLDLYNENKDGWQELLRQYEALIRRFPNNLSIQIDYAHALFVFGEKEKSLALFNSIIDNPQNLSLPADRIINLLDRLYSTGDNSTADELLVKLLKRFPSSKELLKINWIRNRNFPLQHLRHDGIKLIKEYLSTNPKEDYSAIMIHDYAAFKYYEDGSSISVTQQITRIMNKEGKNLMGEAYIPDNAIVTNLRTIKGDTLETIEPELIANKSTITMPNLEDGDFIEVEYIETHKSSSPMGSYIVPIWFFKTSDVPMKRSELVMEYPAKHDIVTFTRLDTPTPQCTTIDDAIHCTYVAENSLIPESEPKTIHSYNLLPNIQFAHNYDWKHVQRMLFDRLKLSGIATPYIKECYDQIEIVENNQLQTAQNIYQYVMDNITESGNSYFGGMSSWVASSKTGSRIGLLQSLLDMAGIPTKMILIQPLKSPELSPIPDIDNVIPYLVATINNKNVYLEPTDDFTPFDYLPVTLQGRTAIPISPTETNFITTENRPVEDRVILTDLDYVITKEGNLKATGYEELREERAAKFRYAIKEMQNDSFVLFKRLENVLAKTYGNVDMSELEHENLNKTSLPFILKYKFESANFASVNENAISILSSTLWSSATERLAPLAGRKLPLLISSEINNLRKMRFHVPENYSFDKTGKDNLPKSFEITSEFGSFRRKVEYHDNEMYSEDYFYIRPQVISAEQYPKFRDFCLQIDNAESMDYVALAK